MPRKPLLLVGGYGVTGQRVSRLLRRRNPDLPLVIAGRTLAKAQALADELGAATASTVDLADAHLGLATTEFSALALIAYDQTQRTVGFAARHGIPYLAVSGAAFELAVDVVPALPAARSTPVVLANNWYSGAVTQSVLALAERFRSVATIEVGIVIDRGEAASGAGAATIADFERISSSCTSTLARIEGAYTWMSAEAAKGRFRRVDGVEMDGVGSVSSDVLSLGAATEADNIRILEAWGVSTSRAAGGPPCDEVCIRIQGVGRDGAPLELEQMAACPRDPSSFTAISAALLLERMAGVTGEPLQPGLYLPEHVLAPADFVEQMKVEGVMFSET